MPLTPSLISRAALKGEGHIHTDKWHRCVQHVKAKGGGYDPYAVCTFSIGYNESINKEHRTPGPHSSRDTRRFKRRKERQEAEKTDGFKTTCDGPPVEGHLEKKKKKPTYTQALKYNRHHDPETGRFASADGMGSSGSEAGTTAVQQSLGLSGTGSSYGIGSAAQRAMQEELARQASKPVHKVHTAEEAVELVLKGENVEIQDTRHVHTLIHKLGQMAIEAKNACVKARSSNPKAQCEEQTWDPCTITVKHVSLFCAEKIKTAEFPHGIPRVEMPQFKSKNPIPGSDADKLPRDEYGEVDASQLFLEHLTREGVETDPNGRILARKLKASQAEMEGEKVAGMMLNPERDPKKAKIWVSKDGYVIDGHHTWAAAIGRDAEDGNLDNDKEMEVVTVQLPMSEIYHMSVKWTRKLGLPSVGVKKAKKLDVLRWRQ